MCIRDRPYTDHTFAHTDIPKQDLDKITNTFNEMTEQSSKMSVERNALATTVTEQQKIIEAHRSTISDLNTAAQTQ